MSRLGPWSETLLIPLGIDANHGYAKTAVENSEVAKRRAALEKRLANVQRWADRARVAHERATTRYNRLWPRAKARGDGLGHMTLALPHIT